MKAEEEEEEEEEKEEEKEEEETKEEETKEEEEKNKSFFMGFSIHACISLKLPPEYPEQASKNQR